MGRSMDTPQIKKPRIWEGSEERVLQAVHHDDASALAGPHHPATFAERLYAWESLSPPEQMLRSDDAVEPYTLQWFLNIENHRHTRHGRWIPRLLEFAKHNGDKLVGLGNGLGTDWLQYARHGASVVVCSPSAEQVAITRRNFELRGLTGRFLHAAPDALPLQTATIDVVCMSGLLDVASDAGAVVAEIYRVLKPGGKALCVASARYDIRFWYRTCAPWLHFFEARPNTAAVRFSARQLRRLFSQFVEHRIHKRHLCRADIPHIWRWMPRPILERCMGRVLVLKAFKPLSAAMALPAAA
jgi:ubiquinone/menaquinone biosynthesis C-methylase UbiE